MIWMTKSLGELCSMASGGTPSRGKSAFYNGDIPWAKIGDLETNEDGVVRATKEYITKEGLISINNRIFEPGTLLLALYGSVGKTAFAGIKMSTNQAILGIKITDENLLNYKYLNYWFRTIKEELLNRAVGGTLQNISLGIVKKLNIPLPPLPVQKKIAAILDEADKLRQLNKQLIAKYDQLTQSLFLDMFGDPVSNPKGWDNVKFSEVGKLDRGKSKHRPRNAPELLGGDYPLIQTGDIANSGGYVKHYKSSYSEIGLAQSKMWPSGTLCITIAANIAKTGILTFDACFPDSVVGFIPNKKTNNEFTQYWMSFLQKIIEDSAPESAQKNINLAILRDLDFPLPPISLQNQFAERVQAIELQKAQAQQGLAKAEDLFNSLLQRAFKGKLSEAG
jgi:type I restriction enzyme, S subunit